MAEGCSMGLVRGVAGGPCRKLGPTGRRGAPRAQDCLEGWSSARARATEPNGHGPAGYPPKGSPPPGLPGPSYGTSVPGRQDVGTTPKCNGGLRRRENPLRRRGGRHQGSPYPHTRSPVPGGQVGGTTQNCQGGSCRREHPPRRRVGRRQGSLFSHTRSPGCGIPQACKGFAEPGGRNSSRAGG